MSAERVAFFQLCTETMSSYLEGSSSIFEPQTMIIPSMQKASHVRKAHVLQAIHLYEGPDLLCRDTVGVGDAIVDDPQGLCI